MGDDKSQKAPQDASRINVNEDYEVQYRTRELGVTEQRLRELVGKHGVSVAVMPEALKQ